MIDPFADSELAGDRLDQDLAIDAQLAAEIRQSCVFIPILSPSWLLTTVPQPGTILPYAAIA